jgi:hypothetical protein
MRNSWGGRRSVRITAGPDERRVGCVFTQKKSIQSAWDEYNTLFDEFEELRAHFLDPARVPVFRTLSNGTREYYIPELCCETGDDAAINEVNAQHIQRWKDLCTVVHALAWSEHVHVILGGVRGTRAILRRGLAGPYEEVPYERVPYKLMASAIWIGEDRDERFSVLYQANNAHQPSTAEEFTQLYLVKDPRVAYAYSEGLMGMVG